jgi:hypothetical protein
MVLGGGTQSAVSDHRNPDAAGEDGLRVWLPGRESVIRILASMLKSLDSARLIRVDGGGHE